MSNPAKRVEAAEVEAAEWHARLGASHVSTETIEAFFAWRREPSNADAYRRVEAVWSNAGALAGSPEMAAALQAAMSRKPRERAGGVKALLGAAAVAAAGTVAFGAWTWLEGRGVYETAVGEQRSVQLADGSTVRLDTGSRVRVRFDGDRRAVALEAGQALFTVARQADRPFVVEAGGTRVTALGTVFDVRRSGREVQVTLVSGAVEVDAAAGEGRGRKRMDAGEQARVTGGAIRTTRVDVAAATSWAEGRVVFRDTPLSEAVAEVNRYLTDKIVLDAPALEGETVNGVFKTGDREAFVSAAAEALDLRASREADGGVRLSSAK